MGYACVISLLLLKSMHIFQLDIRKVFWYIQNLLIIIGKLRVASGKILNSLAHNIDPFTIMKSL